MGTGGLAAGAVMDCGDHLVSLLGLPIKPLPKFGIRTEWFSDARTHDQSSFVWRNALRSA